jgi:SPFH domain / Band 7 family
MSTESIMLIVVGVGILGVLQYILHQSSTRRNKEKKGVAIKIKSHSGRSHYGTLKGNLTFFGYALLIPLAPWFLWLLITIPFPLPEWMKVLLWSFISTLSIGLGVLVVMFLLVYPWIAKKFTWSLEKQPTKWLEPWSFQIPEGRLVARVQDGGGVIDYTMRQSDADIAYDEQEEQEFVNWRDRYDIIERPGSPSDIPVYSLWHRYHVNVSGGLVFGGFYWYTRLHTYNIDIVKAEIGDDGKIKLQIDPGQTTDHIRVRPFVWAVIVDVFTKDRFRVSLVLTFEMQCVNPDKTLFGRDRWERLFAQTVSGKAVETAKQISVFNLLGGEATDVRNMMADSILTLKDAIQEDLGLKILKVQLPGYLEIGTPDERKALTAEAVAVQQAKVTVIQGKAEAEAEAAIVRERGKAVAEHPHGVEVSLHQALETLNAKGGSVIANLGTGGDNDSMSKAILAELKQISTKIGGNS